MDSGAQAEVTRSAMDELAASREEIDTGAKITPVHVFNDVSATITKIKHKVSPQSKTDYTEQFIDVPFH